MYQPHFQISSEILNQISQIEAIKALFDQSRILPEKEIILRYRATVEAIHSSTTIEGNPLNKKEIEAVLSGKRVAQSEYAITEIDNYKLALDYLEKLKQKNQAINLNEILKLHSLVMTGLLPAEKVGVLRQGPIYIVDIVKKQEKLRYQGPSAKQVPTLLNDLFIWLKTKAKDIHPVLAAAILHYEFVSIHPFSDGNGRVTRLITMLYLAFRQYDFKSTLVPEIYYLENRLEYYQALNQASNYSAQTKAELDPWIQYFVTGFLTVGQDLQEDLKLLSLLPHSDQTLRLKREQIDFLSYVQQMGSISLLEALEMTSIPRRTVQRRLKELVDLGLLKSKATGKRTIYVASGLARGK